VMREPVTEALGTLYIHHVGSLKQRVDGQPELVVANAHIRTLGLLRARRVFEREDHECTIA
jgi:hypothetical protein